jgi:hypothetical protein
MTISGRSEIGARSGEDHARCGYCAIAVERHRVDELAILPRHRGDSFLPTPTTTVKRSSGGASMRSIARAPLEQLDARTRAFVPPLAVARQIGLTPEAVAMPSVPWNVTWTAPVRSSFS